MAAPTLRTLARSLGLSRTTVSDALRGSPRVNPDTVARVREAAKAAGYERNPLTGAVMSLLRRSRGQQFRGVLAAIEIVEPDRPAHAVRYNESLLAGISERAKIMPYREELRTKADLLNRDPNIVRILQELAKDPLMRKCQDGFFDSRFWMPAEDFCRFAEMTTPLAHAVVYDSVIQGSLGKVRKMFPEVPPNKGGEEKAWVRAYLRARKPFLISLGGDAEKSTYRVDELQKVADADNWNLNLPLTVRGLTITEALLR